MFEITSKIYGLPLRECSKIKPKFAQEREKKG